MSKYLLILFVFLFSCLDIKRQKVDTNGKVADTMFECKDSSFLDVTKPESIEFKKRFYPNGSITENSEDILIKL
jgi:hypothetical protein